LETLDLGNEDGEIPREKSSGKPTTRRYTESEKGQAVRLVRQLREELGTEHGTVQRVARQLGYGVESVRTWVRERDVTDGLAGPDAVALLVSVSESITGVPSSPKDHLHIVAFFAAELDRPQK
jgi:transposase